MQPTDRLIRVNLIAAVRQSLNATHRIAELETFEADTKTARDLNDILRAIPDDLKGLTQVVLAEVLS